MAQDTIFDLVGGDIQVMWDKYIAYATVVMAVVAVLTFFCTFLKRKRKDDASKKTSNIQIGKGNVNVGDGSKVQINNKD